MDAVIAKLEAQQNALSVDISDMKIALTSIAESMRNISGLEQRQVSLAEAIGRAHTRIDEIQGVLKEEVKGHEKRIQSIEINLAKNQWIERVIMAVLMGAIGLWIKGGF